MGVRRGDGRTDSLVFKPMGCIRTGVDHCVGPLEQHLERLPAPEEAVLAQPTQTRAPRRRWISEVVR